MKKIISVLVIIALVAAGIIFVPKLVHTCDDCEKFFIGTGYEPNKLVGLVDDDAEIICKECAEKHHALGEALGKDLDEYKKDLF